VEVIVMNMAGFRCVLVDGDDDKMILCQKIDLKKAKTQEVIKKIFPELSQKIRVKVKRCHKMSSSKLAIIQAIIQENNWNEHLFVSLRFFEKGGKTCFDTRSVNV